jgi:RNA polymerase sigma-70 factor (family 1)
MQTAPIQNESELLARLKGGDEAAFKTLYDLYAPQLTSFAAARLPSLDEASDIIHDLFVHLWEDREHLSIQVSLKAFLFAAVRYRIIDFVRRNATKKKYADQISKMPLHAAEEAENKIFEKELKEKLNVAMEQLTPRTREVFRLSRFEHLTITQIAQKLDVSEQTVKNQLTTALGQLRALLNKVLFILWWL